MTDVWRWNAYAAVKDRFGLKAKQRDQLDASPLGLSILKCAHFGQWEVVERLLLREGIITPAKTDESLAEAARCARAQVDQDHPWIPGACFLMDERLKPALLAFLDTLLPEENHAEPVAQED